MHAVRFERSPSSNDTSCLSATLIVHLVERRLDSIYGIVFVNDKPVFRKNPLWRIMGNTRGGHSQGLLRS